MSGRLPILLRSGWQQVNIGDIAHWAGALALLHRELCSRDAEVRFQPFAPLGMAGKLLKRWPRVILDSAGAESYNLPAGFMIHGSGGTINLDAVRSWRGKPWGAYGVTYTGGPYGSAFAEFLPAETVDLLNTAEFIFTRETGTAAFLRSQGVSGPPVQFGPDATFGFDSTDEAGADQVLETLGMTPTGSTAGGTAGSPAGAAFLAVIPKLRIDPYWRMGLTDMSQSEIAAAERINTSCVAGDHQILREIIAWWVRQTGSPVLLCPEMTYQLDLMDRWIISLLPRDVALRVHPLPFFWLPDLASSVYRRAAAVVSVEMHSPILALNVGTPAIHLRQKEDSPKGQMWRDIGLERWLVDMDWHDDGDRQAVAAATIGALEDILANPEDAVSTVQTAGKRVRSAEDNAWQIIRESTFGNTKENI